MGGLFVKLLVAVWIYLGSPAVSSLRHCKLPRRRSPYGIAFLCQRLSSLSPRVDFVFFALYFLCEVS